MSDLLIQSLNIDITGFRDKDHYKKIVDNLFDIINYRLKYRLEEILAEADLEDYHIVINEIVLDIGEFNERNFEEQFIEAIINLLPVKIRSIKEVVDRAKNSDGYIKDQKFLLPDLAPLGEVSILSETVETSKSYTADEMAELLTDVKKSPYLADLKLKKNQYLEAVSFYLINGWVPSYLTIPLDAFYEIVKNIILTQTHALGKLISNQTEQRQEIIQRRIKNLSFRQEEKAALKKHRESKKNLDQLTEARILSMILDSDIIELEQLTQDIQVYDTEIKQLLLETGQKDSLDYLRPDNIGILSRAFVLYFKTGKLYEYLPYYIEDIFEVTRQLHKRAPFLLKRLFEFIPSVTGSKRKTQNMLVSYVKKLKKKHLEHIVKLFLSNSRTWQKRLNFYNQVLDNHAKELPSWIRSLDDHKRAQTILIYDFIYKDQQDSFSRIVKKIALKAFTQDLKKELGVDFVSKKYSSKATEVSMYELIESLLLLDEQVYSEEIISPTSKVIFTNPTTSIQIDLKRYEAVFLAANISILDSIGVTPTIKEAYEKGVPVADSEIDQTVKLFKLTVNDTKTLISKNKSITAVQAIVGSQIAKKVEQVKQWLLKHQTLLNFVFITQQQELKSDVVQKFIIEYLLSNKGQRITEEILGQEVVKLLQERPQKEHRRIVEKVFSKRSKKERLEVMFKSALEREQKKLVASFVKRTKLSVDATGLQRLYTAIAKEEKGFSLAKIYKKEGLSKWIQSNKDKLMDSFLLDMIKKGQKTFNPEKTKFDLHQKEIIDEMGRTRDSDTPEISLNKLTSVLQRYYIPLYGAPVYSIDKLIENAHKAKSTIEIEQMFKTLDAKQILNNPLLSKLSEKGFKKLLEILLPTNLFRSFIVMKEDYIKIWSSALKLEHINLIFLSLATEITKLNKQNIVSSFLKHAKLLKGWTSEELLKVGKNIIETFEEDMMPEQVVDLKGYLSSLPTVNESTKEKMLGLDQGIQIKNSGLVLLWPFLKTLFKLVGLLDKKGQFIDATARERAIFILQYLAVKQSSGEESYLVLNKVLVGFPIEEPISEGITMTEKEKDICDALLLNVIKQWPALGKSSADNLRGSFIIRDGVLNFNGIAWELKVENKPFDLLLGKLPWSYSMIKISWLDYIINVDWS